MNNTGNTIKHTLDLTAAFVAVAPWFDLMPKIAATMAVLWYMVRFYEWVKEKLNAKSGR